MKERQLLELLQLQKNEKLLLVGDESTDWLIDGLARHADRVYLLLEDNRPLIDVPEDLAQLLEDMDVLLYAIKKAGSQERIFRDSLNRLAESKGIRVGNLMDVNREILDSAFSADVHEIKQFTEHLLEQLQPVRKLHITSEAGSDFTVEFNSQYNWLASTGFVHFKKTRNLLPAEIYTYPARVEGKIVVDGAYAGLVGREDSHELLEQLQKTPIIWIVEDSRIVEVHCMDEPIREIARKAVFEEDPENGNCIGEFGMGTNTGIEQTLGNVMHDEKFPGVHIAHGHGYPSATGAPYESSVHSDGILLGVSVVDIESGEVLMEKGTYRL